MRDMIRTYEETKRIEAQYLANDQSPIIRIARDNQGLLFYGAHHSNDPNHFEFADIERLFNELTDTYTNITVFVEGHFDEAPESDTKDRDASIRQGGDPQFVVHLARKHAVPVMSPEPDEKWEADTLAQEFGRDTVMLYYVLRYVNLWGGFTAKPQDVPGEAKRIVRTLSTNLGWTGYDMSRLDAVHQSLFAKPLDLHGWDWANEAVHPHSSKLVTNRVARWSGELRDETILRRITQAWNDGKSPFVVFGLSHAVRLEPALLALQQKE